MALRWGIAGSGKISNDFVCAVKTLPTEDHQIVSIAARTLKSAKLFADTHGIPTSYEGYLKLAKDENVDVVYIGLLNHTHLEVSKMMMDHGKHVLCEKPLTKNLKQSRELVDYAKSKRVFLMEAVWSRCFPVYEELKKQIEEGIIGEVLQVNVDFGVNLPHVNRADTREIGGSVVLDIGIYALQFSQFVFKGEKPVSVLSTGNVNKYGTDDSTSAILQYSDGRTSVLSVHGRTAFSNTAHVYGTKGIIVIPSFWCPTTMITPEKTFTYELPQTTAFFNFPNSAGLAYEAEEVRRCIANGLLESPKITLKESLELSELMDLLRSNIDSSLVDT